MRYYNDKQKVWRQAHTNIWRQARGMGSDHQVFTMKTYDGEDDYDNKNIVELIWGEKGYKKL